MKKATWYKHHKWIGLFLGGILILFCLSGIVLNHPLLFSQVNVPRSILPPAYHYKDWNKGLMRGTLRYHSSILMYGDNGVWISNDHIHFKDFNTGFPQGVDHRHIKGMALTSNGQLFAAGQYGLYQYDTTKHWHLIPIPQRQEDERLCDITTYSDSLIVTTRSHVYVSLPPYRAFTQITLHAPVDDDHQVSLFRTVWLLHSGELFGSIGKWCVDFIAILLLFITLTGLIQTISTMTCTKCKTVHSMRKWHNHIGVSTIVFTSLLTLTGWMLRPPAMVAIMSARIPPIPFSVMDSPNPWNDDLRTLRYDSKMQDWLLYTSSGFYTMNNLYDNPKKLSTQPPVSIMGVNVEYLHPSGKWLIGAFNGLFIWDRQKQQVMDYFTHSPAKEQESIPIGKHAIIGYSHDLGNKDVIVDYNTGTSQVKMPERFSTLPMSLRNVCLEIHTGRIYTFFGKLTVLYIFVIGLAIFWCLYSGWKIKFRIKSHSSRHNPT